MEYYAKSENSQGHQETVREHLQKVAALAREYGEALGLADAAKLGSHVHDFGKYTKASQDVLKGTRTGVDHAISSACFLECCYKGSPGSCPVIQPYLPCFDRYTPPKLCPRFRVLRRGDPCVHTVPRAAFPGDKLLRAIERRIRIRSLLRRGRRARRARFPTCGVVRVAGYSVVWDCDPTSIFFLKSAKRSAAAISRSQRSFITFSWCASEYSVVGRISCHVPYDSTRINVCQWPFAKKFSCCCF